ncbi:MAG TPA: DUF1569 domain-containing protein [Longimicrobium sp.]|jgi:hypothetical protein
MATAKKTVFDPAAREELRRRMERVRPETRPLWGKMNAPQMLAHLNSALMMGLGELETVPKRSPLANPLMRWLVIYALPWPRGTPTAPELLAAPTGDWDAELARFRDLLDRTGTRPPAGEWPRHPAFDVMTGKQWGDLTYRHVDHHLRQFGV